MVATVATGPQSTSANSRYSYEYDSRGLPVSLTKPNGNRVGYSFYEDRLLRTSDERTSAERGKQVVAAHTMDYDADGQKTFDVAKLDQAGTTGTLDQRSTFSYTPAGQVAAVDKTGADAGDDESYEYDEAGNTTTQIIGAITTTSNFDRNRLTNSAVTGNGTTYSRYDSYGRLISRDNAGQVLERYGYDGFDRTTREQRFDSAGVLQLTKTQTFDPFDRTASQTTAITGKPTKSLRFTYLGNSDQVAVEEEKNTGGAWEVSKNYAYGPDGSKLQMTDTPVNGNTTKTQYYGVNPHGDIETMTSTDGTTASTYRYTAYGQPDKKGTTGEDAYSTAASETDKMAADLDNVNPYRFSGKRIHGGTGTYDIGFRDYDPGINRFLTRDFYQGALKDLSMGTDPWSTNRYAYAGGNPIGMIDLDGHRPVSPDGFDGSFESVDRHIADEAAEREAQQEESDQAVVRDNQTDEGADDPGYVWADENTEIYGGDPMAALMRLLFGRLGGIYPALGGDSSQPQQLYVDVDKHAATCFDKAHAGASIFYYPRDSSGRATGSIGCLQGSLPRELYDDRNPAKPGDFPQPNPRGENMKASAHLIARTLGGSARDKRNLVTLNQQRNFEMYRNVERYIKLLTAGETVFYSVTPIYQLDKPTALRIQWQGSESGYDEAFVYDAPTP